jgi:hypothetical protein
MRPDMNPIPRIPLIMHNQDGKEALVAKLGAIEARRRLMAHAAKAEAALSAFGLRAAMLQAAARFVTARQY